MSTRIAVTLPDDLYLKYKEYLLKKRTTIQEDLKSYIEIKVQKSDQKEQ